MYNLILFHTTHIHQTYKTNKIKENKRKHTILPNCQGHKRTQYYIYKAIPTIAEEMIEKKL
jgi:hypothetical protein